MKKNRIICFCIFQFVCFVIFASQSTDESITEISEKPSYSLTKTDVFNLIRLHPAERIVAITTVNPDNSPHINTVGIWVSNNQIRFRASSDIAIARNLQRTKQAVITLYKIPKKPKPLNQHKGARAWVKLLANKTRDDALRQGKSIKSIYAMEIVKIKPLFGLQEINVQQKEEKNHE